LDNGANEADTSDTGRFGKTYEYAMRDDSRCHNGGAPDIQRLWQRRGRRCRHGDRRTHGRGEEEWSRRRTVRIHKVEGESHGSWREWEEEEGEEEEERCGSHDSWAPQAYHQAYHQESGWEEG